MLESTFFILRPHGIGRSLLKKRAWFDGDGQSGEQGSADAGGDANKGADADKSKGQQGSGNADDKGGAADALTQEKVNALVANARKEAEHRTTTELLKKHGLDSEDALAQLIDAHKKVEEARLSETEKLAKKAETAEQKAAELEQKLAETEAARRRDKLQNAVIVAASAAKSAHPEDVWLWLNTNAAEDLAKAIDDAGEVDSKAVEGLVGKAKEARPLWFEAQRKSPGSPSVSGGKVPEPGKEKEQAAAARQRAAVRKSF